MLLLVTHPYCFFIYIFFNSFDKEIHAWLQGQVRERAMALQEVKLNDVSFLEFWLQRIFTSHHGLPFRTLIFPICCCLRNLWSRLASWLMSIEIRISGVVSFFGWCLVFSFSFLSFHFCSGWKRRYCGSIIFGIEQVKRGITRNILSSWTVIFNFLIHYDIVVSYIPMGRLLYEIRRSC